MDSKNFENFLSVVIQKKEIIPQVAIDLPSSKSESNRALIINAFAGGTLHNLSDARDTQIMKKLLFSPKKELDVLDAGTTMRFLTAYFALTGQHKILTGTPRMCERPIGILVDALREIGARVEYLQNEGFPPVETKGFDKQLSKDITVRGDVSSQYISALMMMGPELPQGLTIRLKGKVASRPYILMTMELMKKFGAKVSFSNDNVITTFPEKYKPTDFAVESDWSGASYWFAFVALAKEAEIVLKGLRKDSLQGDQRIMEIMAFTGVQASSTPEGLLLTKTEKTDHFSYDFSDCPDLAQTVAVAYAAKRIRGTFTGLESLRIKETDRITALQTELSKIGASLDESRQGLWVLMPAKLPFSHEKITIDTYDDHRMALAFAPLATMANIEIRTPAVVRKSYPCFWEHMEKAGFGLKFE